MYARATDGNLPNNVKFSACSKKAINKVSCSCYFRFAVRERGRFDDDHHSAFSTIFLEKYTFFS